MIFRAGKKGIHKEKTDDTRQERVSDERESDMHAEKKDITEKEQSATARRDVASLKSLSQLFPRHPFQSVPLAVHTFN